MKRGKFIAGITALSIMMMGSGYAMWSQGFTATNTVTTGTFDVVTTSPIIEPLINGDTDITINGNNVVVSIGNAYPGAIVNYSFMVTNNSTIPVKATVTDPALISGDNLNDYITVERISTNGNEIAVNGIEVYDYRITFSDAATNDQLEGATLQFSNNITYNQFNQ